TSATAAADAAMAGDAAALRTVVKSGADVNAPQGDGMTALHWAAEHSDAAAAALLLKAGADAHRPAHAAARRGEIRRRGRRPPSRRCQSGRARADHDRRGAAPFCCR